MIILEFLRVGSGFIMSRSSGKVANWSTEVGPCVELLSRFWEILTKNKIISRKVRVNTVQDFFNMVISTNVLHDKLVYRIITN